MTSPALIPPEILLHDEDLGASGTGMDVSDKAHALLLQQQRAWPLLRENYAGFERVAVRQFSFDRSLVRVQCNPLRITSSTADVDERSLAGRACFLCSRNLPAQQRALMVNGSYLLLGNPFPIFPEHFTIAHVEHIPQRLQDSFRALLSLSKGLGKRYALFYNGPACGASAPDHLHFQAGSRGFMPLDAEFPWLRRHEAEIIGKSPGLLVLSLKDHLRQLVVLESSDEDVLAEAFHRYLSTAGELMPDPDEPKMNVIVLFDDGRWHVLIFPRTKHRPSCYFAEQDRRIVISPAAVDLGGVLIAPRESDFRRITSVDIERLYGEVLLSPEAFSRLKERLAAQFDG